MLTLKPSLTPCPCAVYRIQWAHMCLWARRRGWNRRRGCMLTCEAPAQVDMCLCPCRHSEGKQQSGRVAMRPSGNWMSRSTFLAERVWKVAVRGACFCFPAPGHLNRKWLLFHHMAPVYGERRYIMFQFKHNRKISSKRTVSDVLAIITSSRHSMDNQFSFMLSLNVTSWTQMSVFTWAGSKLSYWCCIVSQISFTAKLLSTACARMFVFICAHVFCTHVLMEYKYFYGANKAWMLLSREREGKRSCTYMWTVARTHAEQ